MSLNELKKFTFVSRYSNYLPDKKRRETFTEAVDRYKAMMLQKYKDIIEKDNEVFDYIDQACEALRRREVLGSQRALQFAGDPIFKHNARSYNCSASYVDRLRFFQECIYLLLCGVGTGFSVQKHHIDKLPPLVQQKRYTKKFVVEDSIEGWADAIGVVVSSFFDQNEIFPEYSGKNIDFDFSNIRKAGSRLSYSSAVAPGPQPLIKAIKNIETLLQSCLDQGLDKIRPIHAYDIVMYGSDCVLSGGIRRSATICLFSDDDEEMINAKVGNWYQTNPQRARSNNSAVLLRNKTTLEAFRKISDKTREFGDPGFVWVDDLDALYNPCLSPNEYILTDNGWEKVIDLYFKGLKNPDGNIIVYADDRVRNCTINDTIVNWISPFEASNVYKTADNADIYELTTKDGFSLICTGYHLFPTKDGPKKLLDLKIGDEVLISRDFNNNVNISGLSYIDKITHIGQSDVYCLTQYATNSIIVNGISTLQCVEIGLYGKNSKGKSGWQTCNLSTVNCSKVSSKKQYLTACRNAAILGTLQAGFTDFPYLGSVSEEIIRREALIGVSMTGIMENPDICLDPETQREGAKIVKETNKILAEKLNINPAARTTCVKPEGSSSCMLGTSSGIHPHHAKRYIRRVQSNKHDKVYQFFKTINPRACERSVWSNNNTDEVISFCIEVPDGSKLKNQVSALDLLESVKSTQKNWVNYGKNKDLCVQEWLSHNVSNTINVKEDEWDDVIKYIYDNRNYLCGISLLPASGDKDYPQAPFTTILLPSEINREYGEGSIFVSGLIERALDIWDDNLWKACACLLGYEGYHGKSKKEWIDKCTKFANNYMNGDLKRLTYCMKDVYNWKMWLDLNREYKNVDFTQMYEEVNDVKFEAEPACAGGACELR